jgi:hypothetical protein
VQLPSAFKLPKPLPFTGKPKELAPWLFSMEHYLLQTGVPLDTPQAAAAAASYLQQSAVTWYEAALTNNGGQHPFASFRQLKNALMVFYQPVDPALTARDRLMSLKQTGTYQDYVNAYQGLMLQIPDMAEADRIHRFVYGLRDSDVQTHVMTQNPDTLQAAINTGAAADKRRSRAQGAARYSGYRSGYSASARTGYTAVASSSSGPAPMELGTIQEPQPELSRLCWNCDEEGHMSWECPKPRRNNGGRGRGRGRGRARAGGGQRTASNTPHARPN